MASAPEDGNILSACGQCQPGATVLIRWEPDAGPIEVVRGVGTVAWPKVSDRGIVE